MPYLIVARLRDREVEVRVPYTGLEDVIAFVRIMLQNKSEDVRIIREEEPTCSS